jgi:hypothetical protein
VPDFGQAQDNQLTIAIGARAPFFDRMTVRKAWASMDSVMCLYQPVYWRTWYGRRSSPPAPEPPGYLAEVLTYGCEERDSRARARRIKEAKFPRSKRLEDLDLTQVPDLPRRP